MDLSKAELTAAVCDLAIEVGFARAGVAHAGYLGCSAKFDEWLRRGWHGEMAYMERNVEKRKAPDLLVPGAASVLSLAVGYAPGGDDPAVSEPGYIARFARGRDYHRVLKRRCAELTERLREIAPGFDGRAFVDTAPVMERSLAAAAGLGWIGRNGCLIVEGLGSYVVLCEIISNIPLAPGRPVAADCGDCDACIRACPTGALGDNGMVDSRKCLSYLTIEYRGEATEDMLKFNRGLYGCDLCQEACPHNRDLPPGDIELTSSPGAEVNLADLQAWSAEDWDLATRGRAIRRAKYDMFMRNAATAEGSSATDECG
ncbi:MAG: tRNA epoxyqueuosine(34) reductase QueG [Phycisphaerae bacterium]|jgi:epoxyqueuosine reductase|nr:tRNA epoxyqueuosine(34) reductase QueG [Phycisphaerae bacterium]